MFFSSLYSLCSADCHFDSSHPDNSKTLFHRGLDDCGISLLKFSYPLMWDSHKVSNEANNWFRVGFEEVGGKKNIAMRPEPTRQSCRRSFRCLTGDCAKSAFQHLLGIQKISELNFWTFEQLKLWCELYS